MKTHKILAALCMLATAIGATAQKYVGGDISLLTQYEDHGATYYDHDGNAIAELLPYFRSEGMNAMRLRLFVDPANAPTGEQEQGVCQDLDYVKTLGKRIKEAGMKLMLDFHYSDTWADPAKQWTPKAWVGKSDAELQDIIYSYTKEVLEQLVAAGATPDFIQTGNEISYGLCWGEGIITEQGANYVTYQASSTTYKRVYAGQTANWSRFTNLLKQAGKACREVCPQAKIVIHTERVERPDYMATFYKAIADDGVDYDIIGLSYYSYYHGNLATLETALNRLENNFADKDIMLVEVGYYHAWQPDGITGSYDLTATYPDSDDGQKAYTEALIDVLNKHSHVTGLFWWFMEANECGLDWNTKRVTYNWYNAGLFDNSTGKAMGALSVLKNFLTTDAIAPTRLTDNQPNGCCRNTYNLAGQPVGDTAHRGVVIRDGKKMVQK